MATDPQMLALTSPTSGGRSVGMIRLRAQAMEFSFSINCSTCCPAISVICGHVQVRKSVKMLWISREKARWFHRILCLLLQC
jgi:hypothetical protein